MQTFRYTALLKDGTPTKGVVNALDEFEAVDKIRAKCPIVTKITPVKEHESILSMDISSNKVNIKKLAVMCSQLSIILQSGVNISRALDMIANQTEDKKLKKILVSSAEDVSQGTGIADAMKRNGPGLPTTFIETIRAGERSGTLENSFRVLEKFFSKSYKTNQKIKQALSYPIFVICIAVVVLIVVMTKVIPTLAVTFKDLGGQMPALTLWMIKISDFFSHHWLLIIVCILAMLGAAKLSSMTQGGHAFWSKVALKLPVMGKINVLSGASQFANTMAVLLDSGLGIDDAIETTAKSMRNSILGEEIGEISMFLQEGKTLGECIKRCQHLPNTLKEMCAIGEETGELSRTLLTIGDFYDNEASHAMTQAMKKIEPTILICLAIFSGFIVLAIYLPVFTMYNYM